MSRIRHCLTPTEPTGLSAVIDMCLNVDAVFWVAGQSSELKQFVVAHGWNMEVVVYSNWCWVVSFSGGGHCPNAVGSYILFLEEHCGNLCSPTFGVSPGKP